MQCIVTAEGQIEERSDQVRAGWQDLAVFITADNDAPDPGAANGYTITLRNPNPTRVHRDRVRRHAAGRLHLHAGLDDRGRAPATRRSTAASCAGRACTRSPPTASSSCTSQVTGAAAPGDYYASAYASSDGYYDYYEQGAYQSAHIRVEAPAACTITGTPGNDVLVGTPGDDVICGLGGDDRLSGGGGNDTLRRRRPATTCSTAAPGADVLRGGGGLDTVTYAAARRR